MGLQEKLTEVQDSKTSLFWVELSDYQYFIEMMPMYLSQYEKECDEEKAMDILEEMKGLVCSDDFCESNYAKPVNYDFSETVFNADIDYDIAYFRDTIEEVLWRAAYLIDELFKMRIDEKEYEYKKYKNILEELKFLFQ